jgi:hypothetical protein
MGYSVGSEFAAGCEFNVGADPRPRTPLFPKIKMLDMTRRVIIFQRGMFLNKATEIFWMLSGFKVIF